MNARNLLSKALIVGMAGGAAWSVLPVGITKSSQERERIESSVTYAGCNEVRAAGKAPLYAGQPGYREDMDGDGDGIACETHY